MSNISSAECSTTILTRRYAPTSRPPTGITSTSLPPLTQRSPSLSHLELASTTASRRSSRASRRASPIVDAPPPRATHDAEISSPDRNSRGLCMRGKTRKTRARLSCLHHTTRATSRARCGRAQLPEQRGLLRRRHERGSDRVLCECDDLARCERERTCDRAIVVADVAAEVRGVVAVDRHRDALAQERREVVTLERRHDLEPQVRQRAHGQRDALAREPIDQRRILVAVDAEIDARDLEPIERLADVRRGAFLAGVRDRRDTERAHLREHPLELARRVAAFAGVEPDRDEVAA